MSRMIAAWGVALAVLIGGGLSFGQIKGSIDPFKTAEDHLKAKELHPAAEMYVSRGEDEVKKASDAADARLKEYRHAAARERAALQEIIDKKALAKELTKQRDELKKEMDQTLPAIRAQVQALQQQQTLDRMQSSSMRGGGGRYGRSQSSQVNNAVNQLGLQINMLNAQSNQFTMTYNELNNEIKQLNVQPDSKGGTKPDTKSDDPSKAAVQKAADLSSEHKEAYVKAVGELRTHVDAANKKYAALVNDADVKTALETLSKRSAKIKYVLGPSKKFLDTVKALEQAEAKIASDTIIEEPKPTASTKKKTKMAKKK